MNKQDKTLRIDDYNTSFYYERSDGSHEKHNIPTKEYAENLSKQVSKK